MAVDGHQITLDLAAFECVDHDILLTRLQSGLGLSGAVLRWIQSELTTSPAAQSRHQLRTVQTTAEGSFLRER